MLKLCQRKTQRAWHACLLQMLTSYNTNSKVKELMDRYDWYFLPIANPDGYEYTHTNVSLI